MTNIELLEYAKKARENAQVDLSGFKVGAALLLKSGEVICGCNIEDPSGIGITNVCAERCAIIKALSEGQRDFDKIAVVGGADKLIFCPPCGACRQYLQSWCPDIKIILSDNETIKEYSIKDLLPHSFNEEF
ncbi:MAG: cytidine deaminase [Oscillospiraceae bacterium]|nr:cytidine deaminase [Oscillospiraceae bacterium]